MGKAFCEKHEQRIGTSKGDLIQAVQRHAMGPNRALLGSIE